MSHISALKMPTQKEIYDRLISRYTVFHVPVLRVAGNGFSDTESKRLMKTVSDTLIRNRPGPKTNDQQKFESNSKRYLNLIGKILSEAKSAASALLPAESNIGFEFPTHAQMLSAILEKVWIKSRPKDGLSLREEGTGYQSLLSLGLMRHIVEQQKIKKNQNLLILLEEPEAFLHPQYQRKVAKFLKEASEIAQLIVSTHSPTIVDATEVQNIMRIERDPLGLTLDWIPASLSEVSRGKLHRWCDAKNSELIFADKVIFCEGISDSNVIKKIIENLDDCSSLTSNVSVIPMDSRDNADKFTELTSRFDIQYLFIFDKDVYTGNRSTLKKCAKIISKEFSNKEFLKFETAKKQLCRSIEDSNKCRDEVNQVLKRRSMFTVGSDIEGALATSWPKVSVLKYMKMNGLVDDNDFAELSAKSGEAYYSLLFEKIKSKGWNGDGQKKKGLKPHLTGVMIDSLGLAFNANSDLDKMRKAITTFLK